MFKLAKIHKIFSTLHWQLFLVPSTLSGHSGLLKLESYSSNDIRKSSSDIKRKAHDNCITLSRFTTVIFLLYIWILKPSPLMGFFLCDNHSCHRCQELYFVLLRATDLWSDTISTFTILSTGCLPAKSCILHHSHVMINDCEVK